ncbi:pre-mRNA-splicing factor sap145-like [Lotus japonicus]|uniref:pre-mRNA-splicing factor sap145-like n=1 Tax=Lotus japonicus TaxID=34305 RepID=UPI002582AC95|nr:pre-mRNA-splicing factor sap145-like [Lotus japonicus]
MKPGILSHELKEALGMPEGAPPPWLINMQRYDPPPSYPSLKIPGLNAPIPPGASFGYHPGGWGKPPVDEYGRPLYGDVFDVQQQDHPNYEVWFNQKFSVHYYHKNTNLGRTNPSHNS